MAQTVKNLPEMQETWVWSLGWEDPLEKGMTTHSSILAQRIPLSEELGRLQSMSMQRVGQDWVTFTSVSRYRNPWNKWHSIPYKIKEASFFFYKLWAQISLNPLCIVKADRKVSIKDKTTFVRFFFLILFQNCLEALQKHYCLQDYQVGRKY